MIEEQGIVVDVNEEEIWVETLKQSACSSCAARNGCGQKLLASAGSGKRFIFKVTNPNHLEVRKEDKVIVGIEEGAFMKATVFMYLLPLIALFIGAVLAQTLGASESMVILSAFLGLIASLLVIRFGGKSLFTSKQYQPTLLKHFC